MPLALVPAPATPGGLPAALVPLADLAAHDAPGLQRGTHGGKSVFLAADDEEPEDVLPVADSQTAADTAAAASPEAAAALEAVTAARLQGNAALTAGAPDEAVTAYTAALRALLSPPLAASAAANAAAVTLHCNLAAAHLKAGRHAAAVEDCSAALAASPRCAKALFRRAQARLAKGELRLALADAEAARAAAPRDAAAVALVEAVEDALYDAGDAHQAAAPVPAQAAEEAPTEDQLAFARRCFDDAELIFLEKGTVGTQVRLLHAAEAGEPPAYGTVFAAGAFASAGALSSAAAFVRSQHVTAHAEAACVLVARCDVAYPHVWYAGHWPDALDTHAPGVFCELLTRRSVTTWFLPEAGGVLGAPVALPRDCALVEEPQTLFPN